MGAAFALSSVLTPFFMGTVVGAIAAGNVPAEGNGDAFSSWLAPLPLLIGAMFVASGAYLAAVFLVGDARRAGEADLERYFARRALGAGGGRRRARRRRPLRPRTPKRATSTTASPAGPAAGDRSRRSAASASLALLLRGAPPSACARSRSAPSSR